MFDEQAVLTAAVDDLNRHRLEAFFGRSPTIPWLDLLRNTRVTFRDENGVDEAIVNAVAHRDYAISGSKIRLFLFADRLELYSPGKLPNTITLDEMPYRTFTRNQLLVSFLSRIRSKRTGQVFLESRGEGCARSSRTATRTPAGGRRTSCSATNCG